MKSGIGYLPINNLKKKPVRTAALLLIVTFLAFALFVGSILIGSLRSGLSSLEDRMGADVIVVPGDAKTKVNLEEMLLQGTPAYFYMDKNIEEQLRNIEGIERMSSQLYLATAKSECCSARVQIIGYDPETDFTVKPWIQKTYDGDLGMGEVIIGSDINPTSDGVFKVYDIDCKVVGQLDKTGTGMDTTAYCSNATLKNLIDASVDKGLNTVFDGEMDEVISAIYIKVKEGYEIQNVVDEINVHVRHVDAVRTKSMITGVSDSLSGISSTISIMVVAIWVLALIILLIAFAMIVNERKKEFAVLRVLGASRKMLAKVVLKESAALGIFGGLIGVVVGCLSIFPFNKAIEMKLGLPFLIPGFNVIVLAAIGTMVICLLAGALASSFAAMKLSKVDAGNILREGN